MIMSGRTQLCEQLVLSDMFFWIFLRFKPSSLNMLEDCIDLSRHDAPVLNAFATVAFKGTTSVGSFRGLKTWTKVRVLGVLGEVRGCSG